MLAPSVVLMIVTPALVAGVMHAQSGTASTAAAGTPGLPAITTNDNRRPAGLQVHGEVTISLRAARGGWRPEGENGPRWQVEAFGESGGPLEVPAPLIRVREGAIIVVSVRNELDDPLRVHGLCARDGSPCPPLDVPPGAVREVGFPAGAAGTYHYWATTTGMPLGFRGSTDSQLSGALIVDPASGAVDDDRVLVISEWTTLTRAQLKQIAAAPDPGTAFLALRPTVLNTINGRAWPNTERLTYDLGDRVRWRVVNLSTQVHPMHLHGFYFEVDRLGDGLRDERIAAERRQPVVTQLMAPGATMSMTWTPERPGNWLFHCHTMLHVSATLEVDGTARSSGHGHHNRGAGMKGLVLGVTVRTPAADATVPGRKPAAPTGTPRRLTLVMETEPGRFGSEPAMGFRLAEGGDAPASGPLPVPGPPLVLTRGEPVEIALVNRLPEATSIHWHGMELESYYDGVHGWSGSGRHLTPAVAPGGSFIVRFTPPRAGTFIYHTHSHDNRQLTSGLYGAILIVEPGQTLDEGVDHVFVLGRGGPALDAPVVINGSAAPQTEWAAGRTHRIRLINITPNDVVALTLGTNGGPVSWRALAKDGATLTDRPAPAAASVVFGVGETYDFEFDAPKGRQNLWLEARSPAGKWLAQGHVVVR